MCVLLVALSAPKTMKIELAIFQRDLGMFDKSLRKRTGCLMWPSLKARTGKREVLDGL